MVKYSHTVPVDINSSMSNIIEFPLDRRLEQMAIQDGFDTYDQEETAELDTEQYLAELLSIMLKDGYGVDNEQYIYDVSFLYETMKSLVYKMNSFYHPIQHFAGTLYSDTAYPNEQQLEFDF